MRKVFWDTNLFIYLLEGHPALGPKVQQVIQAMRGRRDRLVTSTMTMGEVLVQPLAKGNGTLAARYESLMNDPAIDVIDFDRRCARLFAEIRSDKTIKPPDAIQLACAASVKCDLFITHDDRLAKKAVQGISFIASLDRTLTFI